MIYINVDTIRPVDNIYGMIYILEQLNHNFILFSNKSTSDINLDKFGYIVETGYGNNISSFKSILSKKLVIGGDLRVTNVKWINTFINNFIFKTIYFPPGIIDKPVGIHKYKKSLFNSLFYLLRKIFIYFSNRNYVLSTNIEFFEYYAKSNFLPYRKCLNIDLPKHVWMAHFLKLKQKNCKYVLHAPTHDLGSKRNEILESISNSHEYLANLKISIHPQDQHKYDIPNELIFDGSWNDVGAVLTDKSSIGLDFAHVFGGGHFRIDNGTHKTACIEQTEIFGLDVRFVSGFEDFVNFNFDLRAEPRSFDLTSWSIFIRKLTNG